jgi:ABC-2 type transport system permease protein
MFAADSSVNSIGPSHAWRAAFSLMRVDLRQGLRKHLAATTTRDWLLKAVGLCFGLGFFAALHLGAYELITYTLRSPSDHPAELLTGLGASLWAFLLFVMLSGGLVRAIVVLHEQDDSSLLLSSPVSPRAVLAARLFGNALQSCLVDGFIIIPYLDILIFGEGQWRFLWGFPVWLALAVIVTCLDGLFSFGMIRWFGLRRARMLSQAVPFVLIFGVTFFAGSISLSIARMNAAGGSAHMPPEMQAHFIALAHTPLAVLSRAGSGDAFDLASLLIFAALLAWATLRLTERAFVEGTQNLAENTAPSAPARDFRFRSNLLVLEMVKSMRLVVRTPMMIVQCFAQVLTPVGIAFVLGRDDPAAATAFFVIFTAGVLSGMFTIAAGTVEEGDELLNMSPRLPQLFRFGKMTAGCIAPLVLAIVVALGLVACGKFLDALAVIAAGIPLGIASSIVGETFAKPVSPGVRPKLLSDPIMMIPLLGMQIISGAVAGAVVFSAEYSATFLGLSLLGCYVVFALAVGFAQLRKPLF